jgi:similar to spore coat protein
MANMIQNLAGMGNMTEQVIATDLLLGSKAAIKNYAAAITETITPEVKDTLRRQLDVAIDSHEQIANYMVNKGYYHVYNPQEQNKIDMLASDKVMTLEP